MLGWRLRPSFGWRRRARVLVRIAALDSLCLARRPPLGARAIRASVAGWERGAEELAWDLACGYRLRLGAWEGHRLCG